MAGVKWTENQLNAINARNGAVLVSAAAGSGKTAVLVERIIDMITDPVKPVDADRFLVVTYTRAAAGEMKERIAARLDELIAADPHNIQLLNQQLRLTRSKISTIHSFCSDLVREYFYTIDVPADFRIGDEQELTVLKNAAMQNVLVKKYESGSKIFLKTVEAFSNVKDDKNLQKIVFLLYEFLRSNPFPDVWMQEKAEMYTNGSSADETVWGKVILQKAEISALFLKSLSEQSLRLIKNEPALIDSGVGRVVSGDDAFVSLLVKRIKERNWDGIIDLLGTYSADRMTAPRGYKDNETKVMLTGYHKVIKSTIEDIQGLFFSSNDECMEDIKRLAPIVEELFDITRLFDMEYSSIKYERALADYSDLEHWALKLLAKNTDSGVEFTETARLVSSRFDYVMVDEYQDANLIQDTIFKAVSDNDSKLFVVGDVKQSIYRFRQAMPEIFIERKNRYIPYIKENEKYPARIILDKNFRSRDGVTQAVNFVFRNLMSPEVGDIEYDMTEELVTGASYEEDGANAASFHLIDLKKTATGSMDIEEARYIARLIHTMMETETITVKGEKRRPEFGDFCILLRGAKSHGQIFADELSRFGIHAFSDANDSFFEAYEIQVILSLFRVIDNPVQDVPLAAVMLSPIYGFTPDELAQYRIEAQGASLYGALLIQNKAKNQKTRAFTDSMSRLRKISTAVSTDVMLNRIYEETSFPEIVAAMEDGAFKKKNLRMILQYAKGYESSGYRGLSGFVKFIDRLQENGCDLAAADKSPDSGTNAVHIMTIHKSKGLEYPICIVANLARKINTDTTDAVLLHNELGLGVRRRDDKKLCSYTTMPREAVALEIKRNELSEELRVLYVAMTRAKERLVMIGSVNNAIEKYLPKRAERLAYDNKISPYSVSDVNSMCDWIVDCLLVHPTNFKLRKLAGYNGKVSQESTADWNIEIVEDLIDKFEDAETLADENDESKADIFSDDFAANEYLSIIENKLGREYAYTEMTKIPVKVSASAIAHRERNQSYIAVSKPDFMKKGELSGAEKGTAMHNFAQYCDFANAKISVESEIDRLVERGFITDRQAESLSRESIHSFLDSDLVHRMTSSESLEREYRFTVEIPAGLVDNSLQFPYSEEPIILQGAIDCMFEENGRMVIVDYKTDRISSTERLAENYKPQLRLYKLAVEQITGKRVEQCLLYSFYLNCEVILDL